MPTQISLMLAVEDDAQAADWYKRAVGAAQPVNHFSDQVELGPWHVCAAVHNLCRQDN